MTTAQAVPAEAPAGASSRGEELVAEFDRQVANLVHKGYPRAARLTSGQFIQQLEPLRSALAELGGAGPAESSGSPFLLVVKSGLVGRDDAIRRVERRGELGFSVLEPADLERFRPIAELELPEGVAYLVFDVDTGEETRNVTPDDAVARIESARRSPLTIDEGIALITHHPEAVAKNGGFSLAGSRCGDRRVCALWISKGRPKLGWCWAGNPHTWLGTASCASRAGVTR
jgi:Family of unknown function (DUF5701)